MILVKQLVNRQALLWIAFDNGGNMRRHMTAMNSNEMKHAAIIAFIIALRMYGLFLILPVFTIYGASLDGATPMLLGLAVGVYGLTQAVLQVPMGFLSDVWGRKKVMALGLTLFILGSVLAATGESIHGVLLGRLIQGMGAIAATGMALIADISRPEQRGKMMGFVGAGIGLSFMLAFMTASVLVESIGLSGLFWLTAILASVALLLLLLLDEPKQRHDRDFTFKDMWHSVRQSDLLFLDLGVLVLHAVMSALFVVLPITLVQVLNWPVSSHWQLYVPVLLMSIGIMVPLLIMQEKQKAHKSFLLGAFLIMGLNFIIMWLGMDLWWVVMLSLVVYFGLFNFTEAAMPALLSKLVDPRFKGAAMGVYSSSQFFGAFVGGLLGGWVLSIHPEAIYVGLGVGLILMVLLGLFLIKNHKA